MADSKVGSKRPLGPVGLVLSVVVAALLGVAVMGALALGGYWLWISSLYAGAEAQNVDTVEEAFLDNRKGFEATAAHIIQVAESERDAIEIGWTSNWLCVIDSAMDETCRVTTEVERDLRVQATRAGVIEWQAKDDGRIFFAFNHDEAPTNYLMYDHQDRDAKGFAKEHGFTWERDLGDGWSIPGSIPDEDDREAMWVVPVDP